MDKFLTEQVEHSQWTARGYTGHEQPHRPFDLKPRLRVYFGPFWNRHWDPFTFAD